MPGAVGKESKMEKKKKLKRKRVAAAIQESGSDVEGVFTLHQAYAKYQNSASNGRKASTVEAEVRNEAIVRDRSLNGAQRLDIESSSSFVVRNHNTAPSSIGKGRWHQESCITEDGSGSDNSGGIESVESALLHSGANGNGLVQSVFQDETDITEAKRKRVEDVENGEGSGEQLPRKAQKLSEEARVWQYVCKRSVLVSPPQRVQSPHNKDSPVHLGTLPLRSIPSQFGQKGVQNNEFKGKTSNIDVIVNDKTIKVTLTKESIVAQEWIRQQKGKCFGLDLEWQPNRRKGQPENKVALVQISSDTECLLIQMLFLDSIPTALVQFLKDPERKMVGVGIHNDTKKLYRDFGLICGGEVELTTLAVAHFKDEELKRVGLKALAKHVLGFDMNKSKTVTMSNWSKSHLDRRQIEYACMDAWISHAIFGSLQKSPVVAA